MFPNQSKIKYVDEIVELLIRGTSSDRTVWEPADQLGTFVTPLRSSGSAVTLTGVQDGGLPGAAVAMMPEITVRDARGKVVATAGGVSGALLGEVPYHLLKKVEELARLVGTKVSAVDPALPEIAAELRRELGDLTA